MRKLIVLLALILLVAGCGEELTPTASLLTGSNIELEEGSMEYIGRVGLNFGKIDFGLESTWFDRTEEDTQTYGVYITQELLNEPNLPIIGRAYIGSQATIDFDKAEDGAMYGPIVGTVINLGGVDILTEFQYRHYSEALAKLQGETEDKYKVLIGPRFRF